MWIRSALWIGRPQAGSEQAFVDALQGMVGAMRALPGVADVQALWPRHREDDPPEIACQFMVMFDSRADLERMLACPERAALRPRVVALKAMFDGRMSHIEYQTLDDA